MNGSQLLTHVTRKETERLPIKKREYDIDNLIMTWKYAPPKYKADFADSIECIGLDQQRRTTSVSPSNMSFDARKQSPSQIMV